MDPTLPVGMILPYAVAEKGGGKTLTSSREAAAILCLAETMRRRRGLLKTTSEKISFISKLYYPLWLVPWDTKCLVFDGLGSLSANLNYAALPDLGLFLDDIELGATIRAQYRNALEKHMPNFKDFAENVPIFIEGLMANEELLSAVSEYVEETRTIKADVDESMVLTLLRLDENTVLASARKASDLYERVQSDIKGLQYAVQCVGEQMTLHEQMILREIELDREIREKEIAKVKPDVEKKMERLMLERDNKIEKMKKAAERKLKAKVKEKEHCERELERLELNLATYKKRLDTRRGRHDEVGVTRWNNVIRMSHNKISEIKERIHVLSHSIEKTQGEDESDINKVRYAYQELLDQERKKVATIEASMNSSIEAKEKDSEKLRLLSSQIVNFIERLVEQKRLNADKLKRAAIPLELEKDTLLSIPFYLVAYQNKERLQYHALPPLRVMSPEGIVKKIEKTIWSFSLASRIKLFIQPRSEVLNKLFTLALEQTKTDKTLDDNLRELGTFNNILTNLNSKKELTKGVEELKTEGWIKPEERDALIKAYL